MKALVMMLFNTATVTYHPIMYWESPFLGGPDAESNNKLIRYKSKGHHTTGFANREDAMKEVTDYMVPKLDELGYTASLELDGNIEWNGDGIPADIQLRESEPAAPDQNETSENGKKQLLLITSDKVGDTGRVSWSYLFQDKELNAYDNFPKHCSGPFGWLRQTENEGVYYMNTFRGSEGLMFAAPIHTGETKRNKRVVTEMFPDYFTLLCTKETADAIIPLISEWCDVKAIHSQQVLLTA